MEALHNHLFERFAALTQMGLGENFRRQNLVEFSEVLQYWALAMESALDGDVRGTRERLKRARERAERADGRTGAPKALEDDPSVVRAAEVTGS